MLEHAVTVGDVLWVLGILALYRIIRWWRQNVAWEHSDDGGAASRKIRAQQPHDQRSA